MNKTAQLLVMDANTTQDYPMSTARTKETVGPPSRISPSMTDRLTLPRGACETQTCAEARSEMDDFSRSLPSP